jgi:hypothetical protein
MLGWVTEHLHSDGKVGDLIRLQSRRVLLLTQLAGLTIVVVTWLAADMAVQLLDSRGRYAAAAHLAKLLVLRLPFALYSNWVVNNVLLPFGHDGAYATLLAVYAIVDLALVTGMATYFGVPGAVAASVLTECLLFAGCLVGWHRLRYRGAGIGRAGK